MLIENKVQIKAIKTGKYMAGRVGNIIMSTDECFIVYMPEKDCVIDISKMKEFPRNFLKEYSPDKIKNLLKPIELTNKALLFSEGTARLFKNKETKERIWINDKYIKMFPNCESFSVNTGGVYKPIAFTRHREIVGLVEPMRISEEEEREM